MRVFIGPYKENQDREVEVDIHDYDLWNLDVTLAMIIAEGLSKFISSERNGVPSDFASEDGQDIYIDKWNETLEKMRWAFTQIATGEEELYLKLDYLNSEIALEYNKKIQEGIDLFAKYFRNLWD